MEIQNSGNQDFRTELYKKYISTYKKFTGGPDQTDVESIYKVLRKRYLPLLKNFSLNDSVVELGCGNGYLLEFLKTNGFKNLYGIDISEQQVQIARGKGLNVEVKSLLDFFKNNKQKYDIVFALDIVEHFYKNELLDLFTSINDIMNEKGILIIHTPNGEGLFPQSHIYGDLTHLTIFSPNSLLQILRITGFKEINFYETGPVPKNITGILRLFLWKIVKIFIYILRIIETGSREKILTQDFICTARKGEITKH